jgi:c-di-GMP-binding flagellar brake protein YcgR
MASSLDEFTHDRRRALRVDAVGDVRPRRLDLRNVSATGFALEASEPFEVGRSYEFELVVPDSPIQVQATCVRCESRASETTPTFLVGFTFDTLTGRARDVVIAFIDGQVLGALSS